MALKNSMASYMPKRKYVAASMESKSAALFSAWLADNGIKQTVSFNGRDISAEEFDFHITIYYSDNRVLLPNVEDQYIDAAGKTSVVVKPIGFEWFGVEKDVPVLVVEPALLQTIRDTLNATSGIYDRWGEDWRAHISLSYDKDITELPLELPTFDLKFDRYCIRDVEEPISFDAESSDESQVSAMPVA